MSETARSVASSVVGILICAGLLFGPAGTLSYWQAWVFLGVFITVSMVPSLYLYRTDRAAFERRRKAGAKAETRPVQKFVMTALPFCFAAVLVVSGLDHRFGWSSMPTAISIIGVVMVAAGLGGTLLVVFQNRYAAATITIEEGQSLATRGLYGIVRHPMYSASVVLMIGMALALGSYWALIGVSVGVVLLVVRILDEEKMLTQQLPGYVDYAGRVRYRLLPGVW